MSRWVAFATVTVAAVLAARAHGQEVDTRSLDAFRNVAIVLASPRCVNCHISGDAPLQGDDSHTHAMQIKRGRDGRGTPAAQCRACHQTKNTLVPHGPPGVDGWRLPPPESRMAWHGLSAAAVCRNLKDPAQTGGRSLQQLVQHVSDDHLVQWGWDPGPGRTAPPISHEEFVAAFKTWVQGDAPCPIAEGVAR